MPHESDEYLSRHLKTSGIQLNTAIDALLQEAIPQSSPNRPLYRDMLLTLVRMAQADHNRWDAKIMQQTIREMEHAFTRLEQFQRRRKVTVFGSARTPRDHAIYQMARELGAALARYDFMAITGAGGGVMSAVHEGAGPDNSLGLNIVLPYEQHPNPVVDGSDHLLSFHFFFTRKLFFMKEADALVLCPGGFGTLDEVLEALTLVQTGKSPLVPIILLDTPDSSYWKDAIQFMQQQLVANGYINPNDLSLFCLRESAEAAVQDIVTFYQNFHSSRWIDDRYVLRMHHHLTCAAMESLQQRFQSLCLQGEFVQLPCCETERDEPELQPLPRLTFHFNGRDNGLLRQLIDFINQPEHWVD